METPPPLPVPTGDAREELPFAKVVAPPVPGAYPPPVPDADVPFAVPNVDGYRYARDRRGRPGLITALGVIAIVVAVLSFLFNIASGGETALMYMISRFAANARNFGTQFQVAPPPLPKTVRTGPLSIADAGVATAVLQEQLALDGPRQQEVSELLRKHGGALFQLDDNESLTAATIKDLISEPRKADPDTDLPARFSTPAGTVEIFPDHATFASTDGSTSIRTSAKQQSDNVSFSSTRVTAPTSMPAASTVLQPGEISRALAGIRQLSPVPVTPGQIAAIRRELGNPNQSLVISGSPTLVYFVQALPTNELQISFNSGTLTLDPAGRVTASNTTAAAAFPQLPFNMPAGLTILVVGECVVSALFAIYLFVVGIVMLRGSLWGPRLLHIYAYPKILLAIVAAIAAAGLIITSTGAAGGVPGARISAGVAGIGIAIAGVAYPIGALIALHAGAVKRYYAADGANPV
jgi:hypothetical protein